MSDVYITNTNGKKRIAQLTKDGMLDVRCAASFTPKAIGWSEDKALMLSVYVKARSPAAGARGGQIRYADELVWRDTAPRWMDADTQHKKMETEVLLFATRTGVDFKHRLPVSVRIVKT